MGRVGGAGVGGSGSGTRGGGGAETGGCGGAGAGGEGAGADVAEASWELSMTRGRGDGGGGSVTTIDEPDCVVASGRLVASALPSVSPGGSKRERSRAWRPATPFDGAKVRLSWTPRTALLKEIATLLFWPPPTPGSRGSPGSARPIHNKLANVAVAASPADSKVDRNLEAIEDRVGVCRLFSMCRQPQYLSPTIGDPRLGGRPPSEGVGIRSTARASHHNPVARGPRRRV